MMKTSHAHAPVSPTGCLELLWPALKAFKVTPEARQCIYRKAATLAPIPRLALELRLNESSSPLDLHQMALLQSLDADVLRRWLTDGNGVYSDGLVRFLNEPMQQDIPEHIYFEWDHSHLQSLPAIFLPIDSPSTPGDRSAQRINRLAMLMEIAGIDEAVTLPSCFQNVSISHIGLMPSRGDLLRVNIRGVRPEELALLLRNAEWPGDITAACFLFGELVETADKVTLAFNVVEGALTGYLGFEVLLQQPSATEPRWQSVFDALQRRSLCTKAEAACLLKVTRTLFPYHRDVAWPASWMVATELQGGHEVPSTSLALSHIKVSLTEAGKLTAKAYVSAQHEWDDKDSPSSAQPDRHHRNTEEATDAAIRYLLQQRQQNDWWRDFTTALGPSDEWVSAFVACSLAASGQQKAIAAANEALVKLLSRQHADGGWGYNAFTASDADSTIWVLRLMSALRFTGDAHDRARNFLQQHVTKQGVRTYGKQTPMHFGSQPPLIHADGWQSEHDCVTANALPFLDASALQNFVSHQQEDGSWTPYWWWTPALTTALAAETLAADARYTESVRHAVQWAHTYQPPSPTCFVEAFRIRILLLGDQASRVEAKTIVESLLSAQRSDGSWPADSDMRFPHAHEIHGHAAANVPMERFGVFTTAAVLMALLQPTLRQEEQT